MPAFALPAFRRPTRRADMSDPTAMLDMLARMSALQWTRWGGNAAIRQTQAQRLHDLLRFTRERSRYLAERYAGLPDDAALESLPPLTRNELMGCFDDWVTDPEVTRSRLADFLADRTRVGELFLGRYAAWRSSGTTGEPGLYLHDADACATYHALIAAAMQRPEVSMAWAFGQCAHGGRRALVAATGEHFAGVVTWRALTQWAPGGESCELSVLRPVAEWVGRLNAFQPAFLAGYPTALVLLAHEQAARRLAISPSIVWSGGEHLTAAARRAIEHAFGALVVDEYGSSECLSIAVGCRHGWLHLNADWVILEPVDVHHRPVSPGTLSHTALLTNLANRVQPVIRYDVGDRVVFRPEPCECGSAMPALHVEGRRDDVVTLRRRDGVRVPLLPMALTTAIEEGSGLHVFQVVRVSDDALAIRLPDAPARARRASWSAARGALSALLEAHGLDNVDLSLDAAPPQVSAASGKLQQVVDPARHGVAAGPRARRPRGVRPS
ncbi:Phenylacetate-coenzyme A ligase [Burkholderiales bacterium]|nr:Phenylacetate-coenzyme A ligase [Burkholderiales bacterium]